MIDVSRVPMGGIIREPLEVGNYKARLAQIIDLGLQAPFVEGNAPKNRLMFTYEIIDEYLKDENGEEMLDKPVFLSEELNLANYKADRSTMKARCEAFDPQGLFSGDLETLLGAPCWVTVIHKESKDRVYANIGGVAPMRPKEVEALPELINEAKIFSLDDPDLAVFKTLPEFIQNKIKANLNYKGSTLEMLIESTEGDE